MFTENKITEIYCMADDFCKEFSRQQEKYMLEDGKDKHRNKPNRINNAEIIVILLLFHSGGFRCFKHYYKEYVCKHLNHLFPKLVSYNCFVELESTSWHLYRNQFHRLYSTACLQEPTHTYSQDL